MNSIKFYAKRIGDKLVPIPGQIITSVLDPNFEIKLDNNLPLAPSYEIIMVFESKEIEKINPINIPLKREAFIIANQLNESIVRFLKKEEKEITSIDAEKVQDILDRVYHYGKPFTQKLEKLLSQFPLEVEYEKAYFAEDGNELEAKDIDFLKEKGYKLEEVNVRKTYLPNKKIIS